jgi:hypothetical protein
MSIRVVWFETLERRLTEIYLLCMENSFAGPDHKCSKIELIQNDERAESAGTLTFERR